MRTENRRSEKLNNILVVLALLGFSGAFALVVHRPAFFWPTLSAVVAVSIGCLFATRSRESWDAFFGAMAGLFTLIAIAATTGDLKQPAVRHYLIGSSVVACIFVLLTRKRREALIAVALIVGFRLLIFAARLASL